MARLLGRESVSSDIAALFELVKNSYDADASLVTINFEGFTSANYENSKIIIEDNGDGMSVEDLEERWMVIGTDTKEKNQFSRKKRRVIGNKGIGRFATEKLCNVATLISRPRNSNVEIKLRIDWLEYEKDGITFSDVMVPLEITTRDDKKNTGTTIILEKLREIWTTEKIDKLKIALASLILPQELQHALDDKFNVKIYAQEFNSLITPEIHSTLLKNAPYKITATISEDKNDYRVNIYKEGKLARTEPVDLADTVMENAEYWKPFGKCKVSIYFYPGKSSYEDWTDHYKKALKIHNIREALIAIHGVKIYRDGFWVRPYGETSNDWLNLEAERVQANYKVGNSQVIGFVTISKKDNPGIIDTTTRERLVENEDFQRMRTFVKETINVMNDYRKEENRKRREALTKIEHENIIESELKSLKELVDESVVLTKDEKKDISHSITKVSKVFKDFKDETEETTQNLEISERAYRNLASLGISSATTAHEIGYVIPHLDLIVNKILNKLKKHPESLNLVKDELERAVKKINTIRHFTTFIIRFVDNLSYDNEIRHEKEIINVESTIKDLLEEFSGISETNTLDLQWKLSPDKISILMNKADFESIILNLFSNSLKALQKIDIDKPKVKIAIQKDSKKFTIKFSDNGPGVKDVHKEKIFRMFFTTNKRGTGLGLTIVKEIVDEYGGKIEIKPYSELANGATFEISIPVENLKK